MIGLVNQIVGILRLSPLMVCGLTIFMCQLAVILLDPDENPKFAHKLQFIDEMTQYFWPTRKAPDLVGDLNIAPLAEDVWSSKQLLKVVSHTPVETDAKKLIADGGWHDAVPFWG